jgi:hypothetical protein
MSSAGPASRAAVPALGAPARAAAPKNDARADASRQTGEGARAEDRRGKARSSQSALKHGLRAQKYVVLPDEDAAEF